MEILRRGNKGKERNRVRRVKFVEQEKKTCRMRLKEKKRRQRITSSRFVFSLDLSKLLRPGDTGVPGEAWPRLHYITHTHTHTHTELECNLSHSTAANPRLSFLSSSFSSHLFFSSVHDALRHNETVKKSPVWGWDPERMGGEGGGGVKWHYAKALFTIRLFNTVYL